MNVRAWPLTARLAGLVAVSALVLACQKKDKDAHKESKKDGAAAAKVAPATPAKAPPPSVAPAPVSPASNDRAPAPAVAGQLYVGEIAPHATIDLMSSVGGRLAAVYKEMGDEVKKGEVVAAMDDEEIRKQLIEGDVAVQSAQAQVARAKTEVVRVRAEIKRGEVELRRVRREHTRNRPLFERGVIPEATWDQLVAGVEAAEAALAAAKAGEQAAQAAQAAAEVAVRQAQARIVTGRVQLRNARVRAPFAGRVNMRYLEPGAFLVNMNPRPILQIVTTDDLVVRFKVPERDLAGVSLGQRVDVRVDAYPNEVFPAKVTRMGAALEASTRTVLLEAAIDSSGGRVKPGMFARVSVEWTGGSAKRAQADGADDDDGE